ncbi:DUF4336 domain-containing protein [Paraherbaspirillum soli]|uniref:DUF4336 domain-containing protein n=1 Tax=Paraherbaspirillum soli TaxID=631222 RepID=A0ABW0MC37_9BURK
MTVVRLKNGGLWIHSPVPLSAEIHSQLSALGQVQFVVAPNKTHHLFVSKYLAAFPQARLFGAPGLLAKRPDLAGMHELTRTIEPEWREDLDQVFLTVSRLAMRPCGCTKRRARLSSPTCVSCGSAIWHLRPRFLHA